jgi:hypothetical protein
MGVQLLVDGDFSLNNVGFIPPVAGSLEYMNYLGGDASTLARNLAASKPSAVVTGAPVVGANGVTFTNLANYLRSAAEHTANMTIFAVAIPTNPAAWNHFVSNFGSAPKSGRGGTTFGTSVGVNPSGKLTATVASYNASTLATSNLSISLDTTVGAPVAVSLVQDNAARKVVLKNETTGLSGEVALAAGFEFDLAQTFRIGSTYGALAGTAAFTGMYAAIYDRVLTADELAKLYKSVKAFYANRGITV